MFNQTQLGSFASTIRQACGLSRALSGGSALLIILSGFSLLAQDLEADRIQSWEFQRSDLNPSDQWPKGWKRRQDRDHPAYLSMKVVPRDPEVAAAAINAQSTLSLLWSKFESGKITANYNPERVPQPVLKLLDQVVDRCFEIQMDGAAAEILGPIIPLDHRHNYGLEATVQCEGLDGHRAWLELELLDSDLKQVSKSVTEVLTGTVNWRRVQCLNAQELTDNTRAARVHIVVERHSNRNFRGVVRIDNIHIHRVPRLELSSNLKLNVANPGQQCEITCTVVGSSNRLENSSVLFQLLDEMGQVASQQSIPVNPSTETRDQSPSSLTQRYVSTNSTAPKGLDVGTTVGRAKWKVTMDTPGHYIARVYLGKTSKRIRDKELPIAVVSRFPLESSGPFGWSLPLGLDSEQLRTLPQLVRTFGASTVKIPIWLDVTQDATTIDQMAWLIERLQSQKVQCIGVIDQPPPSQRKQFNDGTNHLPIVSILQDRAVWEPLLDPVLSRMTMKLNWFQLGNDHDHSLFASKNLLKIMTEFNASVQSYSQELHLAIAWPWLEGLPQNQAIAWEATQFSIQPDLRAQELSSYVNSKSHEGTTKWLTLDFLPADKYALIDRVQDLTERMTIIKKLGVTAAYVTKPMDQNVGLFNEKFEPQVMAVPWRTLAENIGPAAYVGSIALPGSSQNHIFQNGKLGVMVLWNDTEKIEQLYLGSDIDIVDLWGRAVSVQATRSPRGGLEQRVAVGPWPIIVRGIDLPVARFRMQFELGTANLQSLTGRIQSVPFKVGNPFEKVIRGTVDLVAPTLIDDEVARIALQLNPNRELEKDFPLKLRSDVSAGKHPVRFDFEIEADKTESFSTYHELTVGFEDIDLQWHLQKVSDTAVRLRLTANNRSNRETTYHCKFFPPPYPYQHFQVDKMPPGDSNREFLIQLPNVNETKEFWIRCEEIGTRRVLNYRVRLE